MRKKSLILFMICCTAGLISGVFLLAKAFLFTGNDHPGSNTDISHGDSGMVSSQKKWVATSKETIQQASQKKQELIELRDEAGLKSDIKQVMEMQWNNKEVSTLLKNQDELTAVVDKMPVNGKAITAITDEQADQLKSALLQMLLCHGKNDFSSYISTLKETGETMPLFLQEYLKKNLLTSGLSEEKIAKDPYDLFVQWSKSTDKVLWSGLAAEGSNIKLFKTTTDQLEAPGAIFSEIMAMQSRYRHLTEPAVGFSETLKLKKQIVLADVTLFIAHSEEEKNISPYVIRYWYDTANLLWRPFDMAFYGDWENIDGTEIPF
jgi:hypothetical protein